MFSCVAQVDHIRNLMLVAQVYLEADANSLLDLRYKDYASHQGVSITTERVPYRTTFETMPAVFEKES